jgi:hypothetical protein
VDAEMEVAMGSVTRRDQDGIAILTLSTPVQ